MILLATLTMLMVVDVIAAFIIGTVINVATVRNDTAAVRVGLVYWLLLAIAFAMKATAILKILNTM